MEFTEKLKSRTHLFSYEIRAALLFAIAALQRFIFSQDYYPIVDDWFLYIGRNVFPAFERKLHISSRPLAGLMDLYLITPLSDHLFLVQLFLTAILCAAAYFFCKAFRKSRFACGSVLMITLVLSPSGFEGLYWISAASRIIPSLFFIGASAFLLTQYLKNNSKICLALYILCGIFSVGFYEIFVPIYFLVNLFIILRFRKSYGLLLIPTILSAAMAAYYVFNSGDPDIAERAIPIQPGDIVSHTLFTFKEYGRLLGSANISLLKEAFAAGISAAFAHPFTMLLIAVLSIVFCGLSHPNKESGSCVSICIGLILMLAGAALSFCIGFVRLPFRLIVPMLPGFGMIMEALLSRICNKLIYKCLIFVMIILFSICNIGELAQYKATNEKDSAYADRLLEIPEITNKNYETFICDAKQYWDDDHLQYFEYVKAATENHATITGIIRQKTGNYDINNIIPMYENSLVEVKDFESDYIKIIYYDENDVLHNCKAEKNGNDYVITDEYGNFIGSLTLNGDSFVYNSAQN